MKLDSIELLVIDDDEDILRFVTAVFENLVSRVHSATSVASGLEVAKNHHPHLIIVDLNMPVESGFAFLEKRNGIPSLKGKPVLVFSAIRQKDAVVRAITLGAADYIMKPVNANFLVQKVRKAIQDRDFASYHFPKNDLPKAVVSTPASIAKATELGFLLKAPFKLAVENEIVIQSEWLDSFAANEAIMRRTSNAALPSDAGLFLNEINLVGITNRMLQLIQGRRK